MLRIFCFECQGILSADEILIPWEVRGELGVCDELVCVDCFEALFDEFVDSLSIYEKAQISQRFSEILRRGRK